jgi:hypothetical protein
MQTKPLTTVEAQLAGNPRTPSALRKALTLRFEAYKAELRLEQAREAAGHAQGASTRPGLGIAENQYDRELQVKVDAQLLGQYPDVRFIKDRETRERVAAAAARLRAREESRQASGELAKLESEFQQLASAAASAQTDADREAREIRIREIRAELERKNQDLRQRPNDRWLLQCAASLNDELAELLKQQG